MVFDRIHGDAAEMAAYGAKTQGIGQDITAQLKSSLGQIESLGAEWTGRAKTAFSGVELNRNDSWQGNTQRVDVMADGITKSSRDYEDIDQQQATAISQII